MNEWINVLVVSMSNIKPWNILLQHHSLAMCSTEIVKKRKILRAKKKRTLIIKARRGVIAERWNQGIKEKDWLQIIVFRKKKEYL